MKAEHQSIDTTTFPLELDEIPGVPRPGAARAATDVDSNDSALAEAVELGRDSGWTPLVAIGGMTPASVDLPSEALALWIRDLEARTNLVCLPSRTVLRGEYAHFETLKEYQCEVLIASPHA